MGAQITQEAFGPADPDNQRSDGAAGLIEMLAEFGAYCDAITADRRENPRDDVATVIANATLAD